MRRILAIAFVLGLTLAPTAGAADWADGGSITHPAQTAQPLDVAVDGQGQGGVGWSGYVQAGGDARPRFRRRPFGQALGNPEALFGGSGTVAIRAAGDEFLLTLATPLGTPQQLFTRSFRGGIGGADTIAGAAPGERFCAQDTALGPNGRAIVVYGLSPGGDTPPPGTPCTLYARVRPAPGQAFEPRVQIGQSERFGGGVSVELDAEGRGFGSWRDAFAGRVNATRYDPATGF